MDEVFAALMKKVYLGGGEFLSSLSPVLKSPDKGVDIIPNTLPFPGHISEDSEVKSPSSERRMTSKVHQTNHDSKHDVLPAQTEHAAHVDFLFRVSGFN